MGAKANTLEKYQTALTTINDASKRGTEQRNTAMLTIEYARGRQRDERRAAES
jgi:hypothetical protein